MPHHALTGSDFASWRSIDEADGPRAQA